MYVNYPARKEEVFLSQWQLKLEREGRGLPAGLEPLQVVGRLTPGTGLRLLDHRDGEEVPLPRVASRHFRQP